MYNKMKTKLFLLSLIALAALASCSKNDASAPDEGTLKTVVVKIGGPKTRLVDNPVTGGSQVAYDNATIFVLNGDAVVTSHTLTAIDLLTTQEYRFEQIIAAVTNVLVVVNVPADATLPTTSAAAIRAYPFSIASQQSTGANPGVAHVTLMGEAIPVSSPPDDGHVLMTANVNVLSTVARIEVGTVVPGTGLNSVQIEAVYINNFFTDGSRSVVQLHDQNDPVWVPPFPPYSVPEYMDVFNPAVNDQPNSSVYAYQVFSGNLPHVILRLSGVFSTGDAFSDRWITFTRYNSAGGFITAMERNTIYNLGATITINAQDITPFPEMGLTDLEVFITAEDWTLVPVTPEV